MGNAAVRCLALLVIVVLAACRAPSIREAGEALRIDPEQLVFPLTPIGATATSSVMLFNPGRASRAVTLAVESPFTTQTSLTIGGGESIELSIGFLPATVGEFTEELHLESEQQTLSVRLQGSAMECAAPSDACKVSVLEEGRCEEVPAADGIACSSPCVAQGQCQQGTCVGQEPSCDDGDACTADGCEQSSGVCIHQPRTCAVPGDPCRAAVCDRLTGCGSVQVDDGTACGSNDCVTAHVCMRGICREATAPDGSRCAPATICSPGGICNEGQCEAAPTSALVPIWSYTAPSSATLRFPGVSDLAGNVFWLETIGTGTELVSATRDGVERFRVLMPGVPQQPRSYPVATSPLMLINEELVLVLMQDGTASLAGMRAEVRSATDGTSRWKKERADLVLPLSLPASVPLWIISAGVSGTPPRVILNLRINQGGAAWTSWVASLDGATGAFQWSVRSNYLDDLVADERGNTFIYEDLWQHRLLAIDPAGTTRWNLLLTNSAALPAAAYDGQLLTAWPSSVREISTGTVMHQPTGLYWGTTTTLLGFGRVVAADDNSVCSSSFFSLEPGSAVPPAQWTLGFGTCSSDPVLTSAGTLLAASHARLAPMTAELREFSLEGDELFSCPLPISPAGRTVVARDRWITSDGQRTITAFAIPGLDIAAAGWTCAGGSMDRSSRPRVR